MKYSVQSLEEKAYLYRKRFLELFTTIGFGHVTSAFSWTEVATVLFNEILEGIPGTFDADKVFVSKGHGAGMLFPIFEDLGLFSKEEMNLTIRIGGDSKKLKQFYYPGFDFYGGSLGIGLGYASGMAKAAKLMDANWNVYCLIGDAETYEGSIWEAALFAGGQHLDNLIVILDRNRLGCSDYTEHMLPIESIADKWKAFSWDVEEINGHSITEIYDSLSAKKREKKGKPHIVIANTNKGQGLDYLVDKPLMHGYMPKGEEIEKAFSQLKNFVKETT